MRTTRHSVEEKHRQQFMIAKQGTALVVDLVKNKQVFRSLTFSAGHALNGIG